MHFERKPQWMLCTYSLNPLVHMVPSSSQLKRPIRDGTRTSDPSLCTRPYKLRRCHYCFSIFWRFLSIVYCEDIEVPVNLYRPLSSQLPIKVECRLYLNSLLPHFSHPAWRLCQNCVSMFCRFVPVVHCEDIECTCNIVPHQPFFYWR